MRARFVTLDVFTEQRFAGNPLAVVLDARGLDDEAMLAITREFNFSETTFVLPPRTPEATRRVRIFTPGGEIPFAGHPTVGTAIALVREGHVPMAADDVDLLFDLDAGPTPLTVRRNGAKLAVTFTTPRLPAVGMATAPDLLAAAIGVDPARVVTSAHAPVDAGTGLDFVIARLDGLDALGAATPRAEAWTRLPSPAAAHGVVLYVPTEPRSLRVRVFAPGVGVGEDPATGSAAAALGGLLAGLDRTATGTLLWTIRQGVEMGRPSRIDVAVDKRSGDVAAVRIGGSAVPVSEGTLDLGEH